jgi:hypothetical protein
VVGIEIDKLRGFDQCARPLREGAALNWNETSTMLPSYDINQTINGARPATGNARALDLSCQEGRAPR